jgi:hypothetical protein
MINILIYLQQDATLHSLFYLETALHVLGGTSTHHQERKQLYLQYLVFVTPLLSPAASRYILLEIYEGRTESHEQQFFCKVTSLIIDKPNKPS